MTFLMIIIVSFLATLISLKIILILIKKYEIKIRSDNKESLKAPRSRYGGIGIFFGFTTGIFLTMIFPNSGFPFNSEFHDIKGLQLFLLALFVIFLLGLIDDKIGLSAWKKLPVEIAISTFLFFNGFAIKIISIPFYEGRLTLPFLLSYIVTILWIVGITNAMNLVDGIDGLAGGIGMISLISLILISLINQKPEFTLLAIMMTGPLLAFLIYNFYPSKIYMGDSGSLVLGFFLAILALKASTKASFGISFLVPVLVLLIPITDIILSIIRRVRNGRNPFKPDLDHIHHKLLKSGNNEKKAFFIITGWTMLFSTLGVLAAFLPKNIRTIIIVPGMILGLVIILYTTNLQFNIFKRALRYCKSIWSDSDHEIIE